VVVRVPTPDPFSATVPIAVPPIEKETEPVGIVPDREIADAVRVTDCPCVMEFEESPRVTATVAFGAEITVSDAAFEDLEL
jgi:hypothetical protein